MIVLFLAFDAWLIRYMLRAASYVCSYVTTEKLQVLMWRKGVHNWCLRC